MKKKLLMSVMAAVFVGMTVWAAPGVLPDEFLFTKMKLTYSRESTPSVRGDSSRSVASVSGALRNRWVVFYVEYYPKISKLRNAWIDDITLTLTVIFDAQSQGRMVPCVFTGKTEFMTIPVDGRRHVALMMIPPHLLDRYLPVSGSSSTASSSTFWAEAVFTDRSNNILGIAYCNVKGSTLALQRQEFAKMLQVKPNIVRDGVILSKDESPWSWTDFSDYDYIKPARAK